MTDLDFSSFASSRWPRLVRSAVLLGATEAEAEDVAQTALTRCLVHWARVRRADDVDAYVHRVLINTFTSSRRRRWWGERPSARLPESPAAVDWTDDIDRVDAVLRSLARLNQDQRIAVVLRYYGDLSEGQMALALGIAPGTGRVGCHVRSRSCLKTRAWKSCEEAHERA